MNEDNDKYYFIEECIKYLERNKDNIERVEIRLKPTYMGNSMGKLIYKEGEIIPFSGINKYYKIERW